MQCLAIVNPPGHDYSMATLSTLAITQSGWLSNTPEDVFAAIKEDYPSLTWTVRQDHDKLTWFFEKADGSFSRNGRVLFCYSTDDSSEALLPVYRDFIAHGGADTERMVGSYWGGLSW